MKRFLTLAVVLALAGALAALYGPQGGEAATINYSVRVHPGASSTLTCGWHEGACPSSSSTGHALDWANSGGSTIYWRSYGWCSVGPCSAIATGTISSVLETCYKVKVDVKSKVPAGVSQGTIIYTHSGTSSGGTTFDIKGGTSYTWTSKSIGYTRSSENTPYCAWTGPHLHQTDSGTGWTRNSSVYPAGACPSPNCGSYPITTSGKHQTSHGWTYTF